MHMRDANFAEAYNEFYAGFRAYQEAGNSRAKDCLKELKSLGYTRAAIIGSALEKSELPEAIRLIV